MSGWRVLVAGGMLLLIGGLLYALVYLALVSQSLEKLSVLDLELALDTTAKGQLAAARGYIRELSTLETKRLCHWLVIGHLIGNGLAAMTVSSFLQALELKKRWEKILSYLLLFGGFLSASGYFLPILGYASYGWGLSLLGYIWQLVGISGFMVALVLQAVTKPKL